MGLPDEPHHIEDNRKILSISYRTIRIFQQVSDGLASHLNVVNYKQNIKSVLAVLAVLDSDLPFAPQETFNRLLLSSRQKGWEGILVEQIQEPPGEYESCNPSDHAIYIGLIERPLRMQQFIGDRPHEGIYTKGDIILTPAAIPFWDRWEGEDRYIQIKIADRLIRKVVAETTDAHPDCIELMHQFQIRDPHIEQIGIMLLCELQNGGLGGQLYVESLANVLAIHLLRNYTTAAPRIAAYDGGLSERQLRRIHEYINAHLDGEIKLADMAKSLGMSQSLFCQLFKQSTSVPPYKYVIQQRIERAKQLLLRRDISVADVAFQCGFSSHSHFGKWFRELTGMTPKAYRNSYT